MWFSKLFKKKYKTVITEDDLSGDIFNTDNCVGARVMKRLFGLKKVTWGRNSGWELDSTDPYYYSSDVDMMKVKVGDKVSLTRHKEN